MSRLDIASAALLSYLGSISPIPVSVSHVDVLQPHHGERNLREYRDDVDNINKLLGQYSWAISLLLHSLRELKKTKSLLTQKRTEILDKSHSLIAANPRIVHLPPEILRMIAEYVHPKPISVEKAVKLDSSAYKWDKIVLKSSLIQLDDILFKFRSRSIGSIHSLLCASDPAKLVFKPNTSGLRLVLVIQSLLQFRGRCHSLTIGDACDGDAIAEELAAVPCPRCPSPSRSSRTTLCENHHVLTSLYTFSIRYPKFNTFSGMLKHVSHLSFTVNDGDKTPVNFSDLITETPLLTELTIIWRLTRGPNNNFGPGKQAFLPKLRRFDFVQDPICNIICHDEIERAICRLDGSQVEVLCLHTLQLNTGEIPSALRVLQKAFPSVKSLHWGEYNQDVLQMPQEWTFLCQLARRDSKGFPLLAHLRLDLDQALDDLDMLITVLRRGPHEGSQQIRSLDLLTDLSPEEISDIRESDAFSRIQGEVLHLTVCTNASV